jgi:hypothetical protein
MAKTQIVLDGTVLVGAQHQPVQRVAIVDVGDQPIKVGQQRIDLALAELTQQTLRGLGNQIPDPDGILLVVRGGAMGRHCNGQCRVSANLLQ